jgi:hypothetical protein
MELILGCSERGGVQGGILGCFGDAGYSLEGRNT